MDKKIKVVRIINRFNLGGPTYNATFLTKFLEDEFETTLIGGVPDDAETDSLHILEEYGIKPIIIHEIQRSINPNNEYKAYKKIKAILKEIQPDIVHTHASKAGVLGRMAAFSLNIPIVIHTFHGHVFHSYFGKVKTRVFKSIEQYLAKKSTGIVVISALQHEELVNTYKIVPANKAKIIPLGFDLKKFQENREEKRNLIREKYQLQENEIAIAIVGRLAPVKDHDYFLKVVEQLLATTKRKVRIFIVGGGAEEAHIKEKVDEIQKRFPATIIMTSWIFDIPAFIPGMDIIALTSKNEGTPVSIIEAQASGIPVISTDVGGVRDIIADEKSGYVVKREDFETYVEKLRKLVEEDEIREKFSTFGVQNVMEKYSYQRLVSDMSNYYKELLNK